LFEHDEQFIYERHLIDGKKIDKDHEILKRVIDLLLNKEL
tara:strand:- start:658 stop:777 length:120 start_codon:yes stop_codon:yes gene_type:complete